MPGIEDAPREISRSAFAPTRASALSRTHPMIVIAAIAVTTLCAVGVGVLTGLIPSAQSGSGSSTSSRASSAPQTPMVAGAAQAASGNLSGAAMPAVDPPRLATAKPALAAQRVATPTGTTPTPTYTQPSARPDSGSERTNTKPQIVPSPVTIASNAPIAAVVCANCGVVESVTTVSHAGEGSGAGALIGGVVGGLLGRQVGGGRGKDVATVAGAVGGAVLGNHIEKERKSTQDVDIRVRLDDGTTQTIRSQTDQGLRSGDKVRVDNGRVIRNG